MYAFSYTYNNNITAVYLNSYNMHPSGTEVACLVVMRHGTEETHHNIRLICYESHLV